MRNIIVQSTLDFNKLPKVNHEVSIVAHAIMENYIVGNTALLPIPSRN